MTPDEIAANGRGCYTDALAAERYRLLTERRDEARKRWRCAWPGMKRRAWERYRDATTALADHEARHPELMRAIRAGQGRAA